MNPYALIFALLALSLSLYGQTGPGGVGNAASNNLWLRADTGVFTDAGTTPANHTNAVQQWNDQSGNARNAVQTTTANKPLFHQNASNGKPALRFTGNMFIDVPALGLANNGSYTYILTFRDTTTSIGAMSDGSGHYILDRTTASNALVSLKPTTGNFYGYQKRNDAGGGLGGPLTTTAINTNIKSIQMRRNYNVNYQIFYNASVQATLAESDGNTTPPNPRIGRHATTANGGIRGYIYEFIIYNFALNTAQTIIVNNYLSAKYGYSLTANDIYTQDASANGDYDFEVAGIGRVDASNLHDDAQGTGIVRMLSPDGLGNNEFLLWGHDNGELSFVNDTDVPGSVEARLDRVWRVNEVNASGSAVDVGSVEMRWDLNGLGSVSAFDLRLLVDTDNDGTFSDESPIGGVADLGSGIFAFTAVTALTNNVRFTLAIIPTHTGPGGVGNVLGSSDLKMWYRPDNGVSVTGSSIDSWGNSAGVPDLDLSETATQRPTLVTGAVNGFGELSFDGTNRLRTGMTLTTTNFITNQASSFVVCRADNTTQTSCVYTTDPLVSSTRFSNHIPWSATVYFDIGTCCSDDARLQVGSLTNLTSYSLWTYDASPASGKQLYRNGTLLQSKANTSSYTSHTTQRFNIGGNTTGVNGFVGDLTEVIVFNVKINSAQRVIIDNYLAAKYALTLNANDLYTQDNPANGNYDFEVAGIGRIDASNLHDDAQGTGIVRVLSPSNLTDDKFLIWGHDNGAAHATNFTDVPASIEARFDRVWRVNEVSASGSAVDVGSIEMRWDLNGLGSVTASDLRLLVDSDNDATFSDETPISGAVDLGDGIFAFSGLTALSNNLRFTIATINSAQTPLPIQLVAFDAVNYQDESVKLFWQTASEVNNDYFTIEKSPDAENWLKVGEVNGAGNSTTESDYRFTDYNPLLGTSFYRLKQTDFNGNFTYSRVRAVTITRSDLKVYPNPSNDFVTVQCEGITDKLLEVFNVYGQEVTHLTKLRPQGEHQVYMDIRALPYGVYYIALSEDVVRFVRN